MRLRRVATLAVAAAAAAVTLTAAVNPQPPPEPPVSLPALTPAALAVRYAATSEAAARAATAAARSGNPALARTLAGLRHQHLLGFDPNGPGEAVEVLGNLATARRVVILVPGSDTSLATFASRGAPRRRAAPARWPPRPAGSIPGPGSRSSPGWATAPRACSARPSSPRATRGRAPRPCGPW